MTKTKAQTLKGFRDFLPEEMAIRQKVIKTLEEVFEAYGFQALETPALEYAETLLGKYGQEADKLVYTFKDKGERKVGLRYDLTVPVSRVLAQYQAQIPLPFKRYQIQSVWRADKPQKGRYREFTQCDIDSFGSASYLADAEIVAVIYASLKKLNFEKFTIRINSRQVLFKILTDLGIKKESEQLAIIRIIDKADKSDWEEIKKELIQKGFSQEKADKLVKLVKTAQPDSQLKKLFDYLEALGVDRKYYRFDPTLSRGLDYYTGPIFETYVEKPKIGSLTGGGRYDQLVSQLGGPDIPATGTTIGLDRICDVIKEQKLWPSLSPTSTQVLVTIFSPELLEASTKTASFFRDKKINTELYLDPQVKLDKQIKYADKKKIPWVLILGPDEVKSEKATLKNLETGQQETLTMDQIVRKLIS